MKKSIIILLLSISMAILSCSKLPPKKIAMAKPAYVEINHNDITIESKKSDIPPIKKDFLDNKDEENSPVKIIAAKLSKSSYSDHKDIKLIFKNTGKKDIKAIKLEWYCENSFDEPANSRFFYGQGKSTAKVAYLLKSGDTKTKIWEDFSTDANKVIKARASYVVFTDGTKWELK